MREINPVISQFAVRPKAGKFGYAARSRLWKSVTVLDALGGTEKSLRMRMHVMALLVRAGRDLLWRERGKSDIFALA
jgi:hypothetical protein